MTTPPIGLHVGRYLRWQRLLRDHVPRLNRRGYGPCHPGLQLAHKQTSLDACIEAMRVHHPQYGSPGSWLRWWAEECWNLGGYRNMSWPTTTVEYIAQIHAWADCCCPIPEAT